jgi:hypothetical protein
VSLLPETEYRGFHLFLRHEDATTVVSGLKLLEELYPRGYKRALRFTSTIVDTDMPTHYDEAVEACYLNLVNADSVEVAASLVHEATHAYLSRVRRIPYRGILREKHEKICVSEQTKFMNLYFATGNREDAEKCRRAWEKHTDRALATAWWREGRLRRMLRFFKNSTSRNTINLCL